MLPICVLELEVLLFYEQLMNANMLDLYVATCRKDRHGDSNEKIDG